MMRMLRVYRIFTYFGKLGKRWSDGALFAGTMVIVGANIIYLTLWSVLGGATNINNNTMLVTPEGSFPHYEVTHTCIPPSTTLIVLDSLQIVFLYIIVVLLAILTRNIRRQHFKDTKKVNMFIYLDILTYIILSFPLMITNPEIQVYFRFVEINSHAIICQMFLFLSKCLPPLLRHLKLMYWKTTAKDKQFESTTTGVGNTLLNPMLLYH